MTSIETNSDIQRCGFIAILGFPNAGKSTLINRIVGNKISIVTHKAQTTRFRILGITTVDTSQLVFIDTPGIFKAKKPFEHAMLSAVWKAHDETDISLLIVDAHKGLTSEHLDLIDNLIKKKKPLVIALNKIDLIKKEKLLEMIDLLHQKNLHSIFMISAVTGDGISELLSYLAQVAPMGPWHYPEGQQTDLNERIWAAELTREALFLKLHEELPYGLHVETTDFEPFENGSLKITQTIYVERSSHKSIILGTKGSKIKEIGLFARENLETLFARKVHLYLHVKVDEKWKERRHNYHAVGLEYPGS